MNALAVRLGWLPSYPQFTQNSLDLIQEARDHGAKSDEEVIERIVDQIKKEKVEWAIENPDDPRNFPRVFFNWRSNLLGDSGKGHEYFVKHLIGVRRSSVNRYETFMATGDNQANRRATNGED